MEKNKKKMWFPAKKYGIGWGFPVTWQGWTVLLTYILLIIIGSKIVTGSTSKVGFFLVYVVFVTALLILICWIKGEKPTWRGKEKLDLSTTLCYRYNTNNSSQQRAICIHEG